MIDTSPRKSIRIGRVTGLTATIATALLLGACAGTNDNFDLLGLNTTSQQSVHEKLR